MNTNLIAKKLLDTKRKFNSIEFVGYKIYILSFFLNKICFYIKTGFGHFLKFKRPIRHEIEILETFETPLNGPI